LYQAEYDGIVSHVWWYLYFKSTVKMAIFLEFLVPTFNPEQYSHGPFFITILYLFK